MAGSDPENGDETRAGAGAAGRWSAEVCPALSLPTLALVVAAERKTRGCRARASVSAAGRASGAGRGAEGSRGGGSGRDSRACARAPHGAAGAASSLPPSESGRAVAFGAARLPPDLGAGEWGPRAAPEECGRAVPCAFSFLTSSGGPLPIFRNSFGRSRSPGSLNNSRPPPSLLPPRPVAPGYLPRGHPRPPLAAWHSQLASGRPAEPGPGVGGGPVPARKLESFVLAPRPERRGEEGRERRLRRRGLGRAGAWLWSGLGPRVSSGFPVGPALWVPLGAQNWSFLFPHGSERLARHLSYPLLVVFWGAEGNEQPSNWGRVPHFAPA